MGLACVYRVVKNVFLFWLMIDIIGTIAIYIYGYHVIDEASNTFFYEILANLTEATIIRAQDENSNSAILDILISASSHKKLQQEEEEQRNGASNGLKPPPWPPPGGNFPYNQSHHHPYYHQFGGVGHPPHPPPQIILDQMTNVIYEQDINALKYYAKAWLVAVLGQGLFYLSIGMIGVVTENRWVVLVYASICLIGDLINIARLQETVPLIVSFYINIAHTLLAFWFFLLLKRRPQIAAQQLQELEQQESNQDQTEDAECPRTPDHGSQQRCPYDSLERSVSRRRDPGRRSGGGGRRSSMGQPLTNATSPDLIVCDSIYNTRYSNQNHCNSATIVVSPPRRGSSQHLRHQLCDGKVTFIEDTQTPIYSRPTSSATPANYELNFPPPAPSTLSPSPPLLVPSSTNTNTTATALFDSESGGGMNMMPTPPPIFEHGNVTGEADFDPAFQHHHHHHHHLLRENYPGNGASPFETDWPTNGSHQQR